MTSEELLNIQKYYDRIFKNAWLFSGMKEEAEDITQETFYIALKQHGSFLRKSAEYTWLYGIMLNVIRRKRRWKKTLLKYFSSDEPERYHVEHSGNAENDIIKKEYYNYLYQAISRLPEKMKTVIIMRHFEDMSYHDIALLLNCTEGTVKSRLHNARHKLQKIMGEVYE